MNKRIAGLFLPLALAACGWPQVLPQKPTAHAARAQVSLMRAQSSDALLQALKDRLMQAMNDELDRALKAALVSSSCWEMMDAGVAPGSGAASSYSTTNNQVAGVDEADYLKNDGEYIYILAAGELQIVKAWPPSSAHVVSKTSLAGTPKQLFVRADEAVVYSSLDLPPQFRSECTYGYDCEFVGDGHPLKVSFFNIQNRALPQLVREVEVNGSYISARAIGSAAHAVISFQPAIPNVSSGPPCRNGLDESALRAVYEAQRAANIAAILAASATQLLPSVRDTRYVGGQAQATEQLADYANVYFEQAGDGAAILTVLSFDLDGSSELSTTSVIGRPGATYATADSLYVAPRHSSPLGNGGETTTIHKFSLSDQPPSSSYLGSGVVEGRVLNQFSMDEYEGHLRIATTSGHLPSPDVHSTVSVVAQGPTGLDVLGVLEGIAPGEDIRSVRFDGPRGFVVTFKKTDPLFILDLTAPTHPVITGELKIPGFSTYMQMLDESHLLSIGYDAADQGSFAFFQGVLLQIFDIADPSQPLLAHKTVIGTRGTSSEALGNHFAFNYFAPKGLLAVPMGVCESQTGDVGSFGEVMSFNGLMVYDVSAQSGLSYRGGVQHAVPTSSFGYNGACAQWWTRSSSTVKRSIFMDDYVFSIADDVIKVNAVGALGIDVASLPLVP